MPDPMEALEGEISGVRLGSGDVAPTQAGVAAARRAAARRSRLLSSFGGEGGEEGEEDYDAPEVEFNEAGVPFEPFNLRAEREEGYFDEDGNYVEYRGEEEADAWADSLAHVEVDEAWLARLARARSGAARVDEAEELSGEQAAEHKRSILGMLLPGESVLAALRRLARVRLPAGGGAAPPPAPAVDPLTRHPRGLAAQAMPPVAREQFERLTSLSSALMAHGVYTIHSLTREQLQASLQEGVGGATGAAAAGDDAGQQLAQRLLAAAGAAGGGGTNGRGGGGEDGQGVAAPAQAADGDQDIFAEGPIQPAAGPAPPPAEPAGSGQRQGEQQQQQQQQQQQPAAAPDEPQRDASGDVGMAEQPAGGGAAAADSLALPAPGDGGLDGFVLDDATGLLYNSALGCFFDAASGLFGDAASGLWYRFDAASGRYLLAA